VIVPLSASPSLSVNVFVWADDQVVASETLKWPFGAVVICDDRAGGGGGVAAEGRAGTQDQPQALAPGCRKSA